MKLPRDLSGLDLARALGRLDYQIDHQSGSHLRLTTQRGGEHHLTIPSHSRLKVGTLNAILRTVAEHHGVRRDDLMRELFA